MRGGCGRSGGRRGGDAISGVVLTRLLLVRISTRFDAHLVELCLSLRGIMIHNIQPAPSALQHSP